jgi:hypothetical protein
MQEESAQKLAGGYRHLPFAVAMGIVLPTESDLIALHGDQPVIGDGHAMRVASQVVEHMLWSAERFLGIYHPVVNKQRPQEHAKDLRVCQVPQPSMKDEVSLAECVLKSGHEFATKDAAEYLPGQEEVLPGRDPVGVVW